MTTTTPNTENQVLEPCPFCGAHPRMIDNFTEVHFYVMCIECGACGPDLHGRQDALNAWNARVRAGAEEDDPSVGKFIATVADGLRHAIRDHGDITKERIGSAAKRVWGRIRGTRYDPFRSRQPHTSDESWREWFKCLGDRATADVVKATADLVTNERLAALVEARVLPATTPAATAGDAPTTALRSAITLCHSGDGSPRVTLAFDRLQDAQAVHRWLVMLVRDVADDDKGGC